MTGIQNQDEMDALVKWTYSREEWKIFMRWKKMKEGFFYYLVYRLSPGQKLKTPEITITPSKVSIDTAHEPFHNTERRFRRINIHDAGSMNIMEISYLLNDSQNDRLKEIYIPVPKGKLKEAISVEEKLNAIKIINPQD